MFVIDTFKQFCVALEDYDYSAAPKHWRKGQTASNFLATIRPDLSMLIRDRECDFNPFYTDENLLAFYGYLARHWDDDKENI